jgi:DNA-binding NtrC family response regulator
MGNEIEGGGELHEIVGESPELKAVLSAAMNAAKNEAVLLLTGERGTGKELVARAIHRLGKRRRLSFIKLDCASVAPDRWDAVFEDYQDRLKSTYSGTLLLKGVESISRELQTRFLRALEQKEMGRPGSPASTAIEARLIATMSEVGGRVRDCWLYQSLYPEKLLLIRLPALRERRSDIPLLAWYFVREWARRLHKSIDVISPATMKLLVDYSWPDNVRELENAIERSVRSTEGSELSSRALHRS